MEVWDAYDGKMNQVEGVSLVRGEKIPDGYFHLCSEIIVRHKDGSYLIMQRDKRKHQGGKWEATAGGSAMQGEDSLTCAIRELREETGIDAKELTELGKVIHYLHQSIYVDYLCVTDVEKDKVTLQEGETTDYKWISARELRNMSRDELVTGRIQNFIEELK